VSEKEIAMAPAWVIRNAERALITFRTYADAMRAKGIPSAAQRANGMARLLEDQLAGRKPFPVYRPELEWLFPA
jgi:hypothetical protein